MSATQVRNNLRKIMQNELITQAALARATDLSTTTINKIFTLKSNGAEITRGKIVDGINALSKANYTIRDVFPQRS